MDARHRVDATEQDRFARCFTVMMVLGAIAAVCMLAVGWWGRPYGVDDGERTVMVVEDAEAAASKCAAARLCTGQRVTCTRDLLDAPTCASSLLRV